MKTKGTLWPSIETMAGYSMAALMIRPTRVRASTVSRLTKMPIESTSMKPL